MTTPRFKLYHYPATRSARVIWILHEVVDDEFDIELVPLYEGKQYSVPYTFGINGICYRTDKISEEVTSWASPHGSPAQTRLALTPRRSSSTSASTA